MMMRLNNEVGFMLVIFILFRYKDSFRKGILTVFFLVEGGSPFV